MTYIENGMDPGAVSSEFIVLSYIIRFVLGKSENMQQM